VRDGGPRHRRGGNSGIGGDGVRDRDDCAVLRQGSFEDIESILF